MRLRTPGTLAALITAIAGLLPAGPATAAEGPNLILNGDFTLSHRGTTLSGNPAIPDHWNNIQTQTVNARVLDGAMMFSTAHPTTNVNLYKDYIWQSFSVPETGLYTLVFDYKLQNAQNGAAHNGAKVYVDQFYASAPGVTPVVTPNQVFAQTYASELLDFRLNPAGLNQWHLGQTVSLQLSAGQHTLYLSSGTGDFINQYGASVWFDNVALTSAVPEPGTAALLALGLMAVCLRRQAGGSGLRPLLSR